MIDNKINKNINFKLILVPLKSKFLREKRKTELIVKTLIKEVRLT